MLELPCHTISTKLPTTKGLARVTGHVCTPVTSTAGLADDCDASPCAMPVDVSVLLLEVPGRKSWLNA